MGNLSESRKNLVFEIETQVTGVKVNRPAYVRDLVANAPEAENERLAFPCRRVRSRRTAPTTAGRSAPSGPPLAADPPLAIGPETRYGRRGLADATSRLRRCPRMHSRTVGRRDRHPGGWCSRADSTDGFAPTRPETAGSCGTWTRRATIKRSTTSRRRAAPSTAGSRRRRRHGLRRFGVWHLWGKVPGNVLLAILSRWSVIRRDHLARTVRVVEN